MNESNFKLSEFDLDNAFFGATLHRARDYVERGKIVEIKANRNFTEIRSKVSGSSKGVYNQDISIYPSRKGWIIEDYCSCPVGGKCKHVAAVLLTLTKNAGQTASSEDMVMNQWLERLEKEPSTSKSNRSERDLIYILNTDNDGVYLSLRNSKINKKGFYTKGTQISVYNYNGFISNLPWGIEEEERNIIHILSNQVSGNLRLSFEGDLGFLLLKKIHATQRLFWEDNREPLRFDSNKSLHCHWKTGKSGLSHLNLELENCQSWEMIATEPPVYVDLDSQTLGIIDTDISSNKLQLLQDMPPVAEKSLKKISRSLAQFFPMNAVPLPVELDIHAVTSDVVAKLILLQNDDGQPEVKLEFRYEKWCLPCASKTEGITLLSEGKQEIQIFRQLDKETSFIGIIQNLGFYDTGEQLNGDRGDFFSLGKLPVAIMHWLHFIETEIPKLKDQGFEIEMSPDFNLNVIETDVDIEVEDEGYQWFSVALSADINGEKIVLLPLIQQWLSKFGEPKPDELMLLPTSDGRFIRVKAEQVRPLISTIMELFNKDDTELKVPRNRALLLNELSEQQINLINGERLQLLADKLQDFDEIQPVVVPKGVNAELRLYQQEGLNWLSFLKEYQLGGILADDMGLGKTLQALTFVFKQHLDDSQSRTLIVCPTSLVGNWAKEAARFIPDLSVTVIHGAKRKTLLETLSAHQIIITSYPLIQRDRQYYVELGFDHIILDEAQQIKNANAKVTQFLNEIKGKFRLCLTGTPLENHLGELKSLMDFCLPGLLGHNTFFAKHYRKSIEKEGNREKARELSHRISPFLLRRTKSEVVGELPPKTEMSQVLPLEKDQRNLYETIRVAMEKKVRDLFAQKGAARSQIEFLDALLKLRQVCCDAKLVKLTEAQKVKNNAKLDWLSQNLPEMLQEGRKVLIFSQFTSMLGIIEGLLKDQGISYSKLTGQTRKRQEQIDAFQEGDNQVFLISLKAGGTGLNLTAADTVIHYDPWWNPAVERQATDRAYRIGQDKPVFVYKLIAEGTVEEKIQAMQAHKQGLADSILSGDKQGLWKGNADDLLALFKSN